MDALDFNLKMQDLTDRPHTDEEMAEVDAWLLPHCHFDHSANEYTDTEGYKRRTYRVGTLGGGEGELTPWSMDRGSDGLWRPSGLIFPLEAGVTRSPLL